MLMSDEKQIPTWQSPYDQHNFSVHHYQQQQEPNFLDQAGYFVPYANGFPQQTQYSSYSSIAPFQIGHFQQFNANPLAQAQAHYSYQSPNYPRQQFTPDSSFSDKPSSAADLIFDIKKDETEAPHAQPHQYQQPAIMGFGWPAPQFQLEDRSSSLLKRSKSLSFEDTQTTFKARDQRRSLPKNVLLDSEESALSQVEQLQKDSSLWELLNSVPKKGSSYKCSHCTEQFNTVESFILHLEKYKLVRSNKCPVKDCPYRIIGLPRKPELRRHCLSQHSETLENLLRLKFQEGIEPDVRTLSKPKNNESEVDPKKKKPNVCPREGCGKKFRRKDSLQRHERLVHENQNSRFNQRLRMQKTILGDDLDG
ncbi:hypothetical protein KL934_003843 [Ogataea polymorpha]|nr:hypothetical protein KL934_003843 [Ogataea polymorpha]